MITELLDKLQGARYFSKFNVRWGYNNIRIKENDEWKAAFKCSLGLFELMVMTFGLCNTPATFQAFKNKIFEDLIDNGHTVVYLNDILLFHGSIPELHNLTHEVLHRLKAYDLFLKPEKCSFDQLKIEYLGILIMEGCIRMDPVKVKAIIEWPTPKILKQVQSFLGFCNFYHRFIKNYFHIVRPLTGLTKKDTPFHWNDLQKNTFASLIRAFTSAPVLALSDQSLPFRIITDTSDYALGAILEQSDALNHWHPIAFYLKSMAPPELNYDIHDKELLAIIHALETY